MLYMSSVRAVDSVNISCEFCDRYFQLLKKHSLHISI
jgi:hypothetical protein